MLRGQHVVLRAIEREDLQRLHQLREYVDLEILAGGSWEPYSLAAIEKHWEKNLDNEQPNRFAIVVDDVVIGDCGIHHVERRDGTAAIGIAIFDPAYLNKGYGRDALNTLIDWAFRIQNYRRLWLDTFGNNPRAVRSYLACGFVHEGVQRQHYYVDGEYRDAVLMGLLRTEWEERQRAAQEATATS
jgi:diamine N-acetyltransferase